MTAYLQPGDTIHIVTPMPMRHGSPDIEKAQQDGNNLSRLYASYGVTIASYQAYTDVTTPTVVAVFRNPAPSTPDTDKATA